MKLRMEGKLLLEISVMMRILPIFLWRKQARGILCLMCPKVHERWLKHYYNVDINFNICIELFICSVLERICISRHWKWICKSECYVHQLK